MDRDLRALPEEFVLLTEIDRDKSTRSAHVGGHGRTRSQAADRVEVWTGRMIPYFFTGQNPPPPLLPDRDDRRDSRAFSGSESLREIASRTRGKILPRRGRPSRIRPDVSGRRDPLTHRDDCKATRLLIVWHRRCEVRVPPLALFTNTVRTPSSRPRKCAGGIKPSAHTANRR